MDRHFTEGRQRVAIGTALAVQLILFGWSMDDGRYSMFCTASKSPDWSWFGYLHVAFIGLFLLGLVSLAIPRSRLPYAVLLLPALLALPFQGELLDRGILYCDGP